MSAARYWRERADKAEAELAAERKRFALSVRMAVHRLFELEANLAGERRRTAEAEVALTGERAAIAQARADAALHADQARGADDANVR
jgi:hypothetical protein